VKYLVDTNVISEIRKGTRCNPGVSVWYATVVDEDLCLSVLVLGEIRKGVELLRSRDPQQAQVLEAWLDTVAEAFGERALPIEAAVAEEWGRLNAVRPIPVIDGLLAATAKVHSLTLVTRNEADVAGLGAAVLNPFT
jgi:predicted nucleic acid-binding protein